MAHSARVQISALNGPPQGGPHDYLAAISFLSSSAVLV
jgi:hypothetical protein